jgi:hypothetical protein
MAKPPPPSPDKARPGPDPVFAEMQAEHERTLAVAATVVGLAEDQARAVLTEHRCVLRVATRDGQVFPLLLNFQPSRVTVEVENGRVVRATAG